jgi:imidazolonepropionase
MLALRASGVATLEVKSGYGLDVDTELRMLQAARTAARELGLSVRTTFLGAHAMPPDFAGGKDDYIDFIVDESLPAAHAAGLVDAVDAYCESIAFSGAQVARVFDKALALGLPVKLHADQLSDAGGAALAAAYRALSADHLEYADEAGVRAMAEAGCVAVLLPGAFVTLGESRMPPVPLLREAGVPIAIASDCNPGTSPLSSLTFAMQLASRVFRLTPDECFDGVTRHAARALGLCDRGTLKVGKRADLAVWDFAHPRELSYWMGRSWLDSLYVAGTCRISA